MELEERPPAGAPAAAECYRHPGRETGVRCTRCGRPICPDCMVSASVGFQCPECVRDGAKSARPPRTEFGGRVPSTPAGRPGTLRAALGRDAAVTKALIGLNVLVWLLAQVYGQAFVDRFALIGGAYSTTLGHVVGVAVSPWQSYRLLTAVFLHQQALHIAMNMISLWWIGPPLERMLGRLRYLAVFLVSGIAGCALSFLLASPNQESLGASGAIFGLLGASVVLYRRRGFALGPLVALIVFNLVLTFSVSGIDWRAHVGGLVAGGIAGGAMAYAPARYRNLVQAGAVVALLAVVGVLVWLGTNRLTG